MAAKLAYQSGVDVGAVVRARRQVIGQRLLAGFGLLIIGVVVLVGVAAFWAFQPVMNSVAVTVVNATSEPLTDAGFDGLCNDRVVSVGPIRTGQSRSALVTYDENDCPITFVFDQSGRTWRVPLSGNVIDDGDAYTVTIAPGSVVARRVARGGATTQFVRVPTTRPIQY